MVVNQFGKFLELDVAGADFFVQYDVSDLCKEPGVVIAGKEGSVYTECFGDFQQDGDGQWAGVVLDLVDVASGQAECGCESGLAEVAFATKLSEAGAYVSFAHVATIRDPDHCCEELQIFLRCCVQFGE